MKSIIRIGAVLAAAAIMTACAGVNFVKPADDKLVVGTTTKSQVLAIMGAEPNGKGEKLANGEKLESVIYAYATVGGESVFPGVTPARAIGFTFHKDTLVGKEFTSSFNVDNTWFDPEKAKSIKQGMTTAEVVALMGKPGGEYRYPVIANRNGKALVYMFTQTKGFTSQQSLLSVEVDERGVVQKSEYTQVGQL
jgi:outer membrane protein assembly factor BamE (lipoprotein component of BamABCDE complex)